MAVRSSSAIDATVPPHRLKSPRCAARGGRCGHRVGRQRRRSAMPAMSALIRPHFGDLSSLRRRRLAPMTWARRRTERVRSPGVCASPTPAACACAAAGQLGDTLGQQRRVRRVGDVGLDHRRVGAHPVGLQHLGLDRLAPATPRSARRSPSPAAGGDLHQRRRMRHPPPNGTRQNRRQVIESVTSHTTARTRAGSGTSEHHPQYVSIGIDGRPYVG